HLVHLIEKDLLAGLLGQWVQTQGVLIHGAIVLDAWRWGGSDGEVLQTFPSLSDVLKAHHGHPRQQLQG
ncbi:MAG: hypothetical protein J0H16_10165, partial [Alicycliphilus denitrificans]|nr:hypothetical protein [Alicycliphilus denitrificans]